MSTTILALFDEEATADIATQEISDLGYDDLQWEFITDETSDIRIMPGLPGWRGGAGADTSQPAGFVQETDADNTYSLDDLGLSDEEKEFYASGIGRNAMLLVVHAPDEAVDQVHHILRNHQAGRYMEA